jgi:3-methylcrotonyl-CoA carboxylase alpha subunit
MSYEWVGPRETNTGVLRDSSGVQKQVAWHVGKDGATEVWLDGVVHRIASPSPKRGGKTRVESHQSQLVAGMPGVVLQLRAEVGQTVEPGQVLVVMESMKMELTLEAPRAGRVQSVHCQVGQMIEMNALLIQLEPNP